MGVGLGLLRKWATRRLTSQGFSSWGAWPQRGMAKWSLQFKGGIRYYTGKWDGQSLRGNFSRDPSGASPIGTFELRPR